MKYFFLLVILFLVGCVDSDKKKTQPTPHNNALSYTHECNIVAGLGYKIDMDACVKHVNNPKFKRGSIHKLKENSRYDSECSFKIYRPMWSHGSIVNTPAYVGTLDCPAGNGFGDSIQESELK